MPSGEFRPPLGFRLLAASGEDVLDDHRRVGAQELQRLQRAEGLGKGLVGVQIEMLVPEHQDAMAVQIVPDLLALLVGKRTQIEPVTSAPILVVSCWIFGSWVIGLS